MGCGVPRFRAERDFQKTFSTEGELSLKAATVNGGISISAHSGPTVELVAHLVALANTQSEADALLEKIDPVCVQNGKELSIATIKPPSGMQISVSLELKVPSQTVLDLSSSNGRILVKQVAGPIKAKTSNGGVAIESASSLVDVRTSNGEIKLSQCVGPIQLSTSNGRVELEQCELQGDNEIRSSNGGLSLQLTNAQPISVEMTTSNGSIRCDVPFEATRSEKNRKSGILFPSPTETKPEGSLKLSTSNGSITLTTATR